MENAQTIGKLLKKARDKKKVSLEDIAEKTKININILRSLEKEDLDKLPNKTYVKGFVKNYARTVGINTDEALQCLEHTYGNDQQTETPTASPYI
jgi:cytoskeleton protein RodZ